MMHDERKRKRLLILADILVAAFTLAVGVLHFAETFDWAWILWVVIVICLYLRNWTLRQMYDRARTEEKTWRMLYQQQTRAAMDLAWQVDEMKKGEKK